MKGDSCYTFPKSAAKKVANRNTWTDGNILAKYRGRRIGIKKPENLVYFDSLATIGKDMLSVVRLVFY